MDLKFSILVFVLQLHIATSYKSYKFGKLCPTNTFRVIVGALLDDKPTVELENSKDLSAAILSQKWDDKTYKAVDCKFMVIAKTPRNGQTRGIFASIRQMNLRKGPSPNECTDYVIFEVGNGENQKSEKMCGIVEGNEAYEASKFLEAPRGSIKVTIYINRYVKLEPGKQLGVEFIFTSYDDCSWNKLECQSNKCISQDLYNDTILNCPPPGCRDEPSLEDICSAKPIYQPPSSHVLAISALTSLFLVMFAIVTCWYCFKFRNCWNDNQTHNSNTSGRSGASRPDMEFQTIRIPTTPEMAATAPPNVDDHDKPPSYDSLFKDRKVV